jgi:predicted methyltransferase
MKACVHILAAVIVVGLTGSLPAVADDDQIARAIASDHRSDSDRERDAASKPELMLALLDLESGQAVVDLFAGGGYFSDLLAGVVGPQGTVILQNNYGFAKWVDEYLQERYIDNEVPPITVLRSEVEDLMLEPSSLDAAIMSMCYHDLYYYNPEAGFRRTDVPAFFAQLHTALKPGGKLLVIDHAAADGSGNSLTHDLHRVDEAFAKQDIESNGFRLVNTSDALRNPDDPRTAKPFDPSIYRKTDRFVMLFVKD